MKPEYVINFVIAAVIVMFGLASPALSLPRLEITYEQAQEFFSKRPAKMVMLWVGPYDDLRGVAGSVYMVDFSSNPLELKKAFDGAWSWFGDPTMSRDGNRITYNKKGEVCIRYLDALNPGEKKVGDGYDQRWWIHPLTGDEYIIWASTPWKNSQDIRGKTYIRKIKKGSTEPSEPQKVLLKDYAFRCGRSADGEYIFTAQPGFALARLKPHAIENAFSKMEYTKSSKCNGAYGPDINRPLGYMWLEEAHSAIMLGDDDPIELPSGYGYNVWPEWSTHPDYITTNVHVKENQEMAADARDAWVYRISESRWTQLTSSAGPCQVWVSQCNDTSPPSPPSSLAATVSGAAITLNWNAGADSDCSGIRYHNVYRTSAGGAFESIAQSSGLSYVDTSAAASQCFTYAVSAVNSALLESAKSNKANACTGLDSVAPAIAQIIAHNESSVWIVFSESVDGASAAKSSNYSINNSINISSLTLHSPTTVILTTSELAEGIEYIVTVNNVKDLANPPNTIAANTSRNFTWIRNTVPAPVISPSGREFSSIITVYLTVEDSTVKVYYTLDGSEPTQQSKRYTQPIEINKTATLKARAFKAGMNPSTIAIAAFTRRLFGEIVYPAGGEVIKPGSQMKIRWKSYDTQKFNLAMIYLSIDMGLSWIALTADSSIRFADDGDSDGELTWNVPQKINGITLDQKQAMLKIRQYTGDEIDISEPFYFSTTGQAIRSGTDISRLIPSVTVLSVDYKRTLVTISASSEYEFELVDCTGRQWLCAHGTGNMQFILNKALPPGIYLARILTGKRIIIRQNIIVR